MGDWAGIITPKKGLGGWKAEKLDLGLDGQRCGGNGCQQAGEQEDRLDCQGDSWVTSTGPVGTWEVFQVPSCKAKSLWMECEEPTLAQLSMPGVLGGCGEVGEGHKGGGNFTFCCLPWGDVCGGEGGPFF